MAPDDDILATAKIRVRGHPTKYRSQTLSGDCSRGRDPLRGMNRIFKPHLIFAENIACLDCAGNGIFSARSMTPSTTTDLHCIETGRKQ